MFTLEKKVRTHKEKVLLTRPMTLLKLLLKLFDKILYNIEKQYREVSHGVV